MSFKRLAAMAGVVLVVLIVVQIVLLGSQPTPEDPAQDIVDYLADDNAAHKAASLLGHVVLVPAAVFFAGLVVRLRVGDRARDEGWAIVALIGAATLAATSGTGDALSGGLFLREGAGLNPATVQGIYDAQYVAYTAGAVAIAVIAASVTVPALVHGDFPRLYGWLSAVVVVLGLVGALATVSRTGGVALAFVGFVPLLVWTLATSWVFWTDDETALAAA